jgi:peroxiredoxin
MRIVKTIQALLVTLAILRPFLACAGSTAEVAPQFSLSDTQQNRVDLAGYQGKVVLLTFWTTWCVACREELPGLDRLHQRLADKGFTVLSVCVEPSTAMVSGYLRHHPVSFPVLIDQNGAVADRYRLSGFPASFILGKDGAIRHRHLGYGNESLALYEKEILDLLQQ